MQSKNLFTASQITIIRLLFILMGLVLTILGIVLLPYFHSAYQDAPPWIVDTAILFPLYIIIGGGTIVLVALFVVKPKGNFPISTTKSENLSTDSIEGARSEGFQEHEKEGFEE